MTYLVTGATGFIGTRLVNALLGQGHAVYYLARKRSPKLPSQASFHPWETNRQPELNALSRIDGVFHLTGEPIAQRWTPEVKRRIYDSRVQGTKNLVAAIAALRHKPSVLVTASAVGYYGDRGEEVLDESTQAGADFLALTCRDWEAAAFGARELGLRVVPIRIATVLGREGGALPKMMTPFLLGIGGRFGTGKQWMPWIHVEDLIRLFLFAADTQAVDGPLNGASPEPVTNAKFTKVLGSVLHRPTLFAVPKFALKMALGEMAEFVFESQRVVPKAAEQAGFRFEHAQLREALASLIK